MSVVCTRWVLTEKLLVAFFVHVECKSGNVWGVENANVWGMENGRWLKEKDVAGVLNLNRPFICMARRWYAAEEWLPHMATVREVDSRAATTVGSRGPVIANVHHCRNDKLAVAR